MARISYLGIANAIKKTLEEDEVIAAQTRAITLCEDNIAAAEIMPWIGIYPITRRPAATPLAAGTMQRFDITYEIWVYSFSMVGPEEALTLTEELLGLVELAILRNPTLGGLAQAVRFDGGDFDNAKTEGSFVMGGSVRLNVLALARTT